MFPEISTLSKPPSHVLASSWPCWPILSGPRTNEPRPDQPSPSSRASASRWPTTTRHWSKDSEWTRFSTLKLRLKWVYWPEKDGLLHLEQRKSLIYQISTLNNVLKMKFLYTNSTNLFVYGSKLLRMRYKDTWARLSVDVGAFFGAWY